MEALFLYGFCTLIFNGKFLRLRFAEKTSFYMGFRGNKAYWSNNNKCNNGDVIIQAYLNKTNNQSRDKLHVEHPRTACTLEGFLVGII